MIRYIEIGGFLLLILIFGIFLGGSLSYPLSFTFLDEYGFKMIICHFCNIILVMSLMYHLRKQSYDTCIFLLKVEKKSAHNFCKYFVFGCIFLVIVGTVGYFTNTMAWRTDISLNWALLLSSTLLVPFFIAFTEELVFRGLIMPYLKEELGKTSSIILSSLLFAIVHLNYNGFLPFVSAFLFGIILAIFTIRTNSLLPAIGFHYGWNFMASFYDEFFEEVTNIPFWGNLFKIPQIILLLLVLSFLIFQGRRHKTKLNGI